MTHRVSVEPFVGLSYRFVDSRGDLDIVRARAQSAFWFGDARTVAVLKVESKRQQKIIDLYDGEWLSTKAWWKETKI